MYSRQIKLMSATVGAGALLAMAGVTLATTSAAQDEPEPEPPGPIATSEITTGETVTETGAPEEPETTVFTPPITTPPEPIPTGEPQ